MIQRPNLAWIIDRSVSLCKPYLLPIRNNLSLETFPIKTGLFRNVGGKFFSMHRTSHQQYFQRLQGTRKKNPDYSRPDFRYPSSMRKWRMDWTTFQSLAEKFMECSLMHVFKRLKMPWIWVERPRLPTYSSLLQTKITASISFLCSSLGHAPFDSSILLKSSAVGEWIHTWCNMISPPLISREVTGPRDQCQRSGTVKRWLLYLPRLWSISLVLIVSS